jgi:hypothetical protein
MQMTANEARFNLDVDAKLTSDDDKNRKTRIQIVHVASFLSQRGEHRRRTISTTTTIITNHNTRQPHQLPFTITRKMRCPQEELAKEKKKAHHVSIHTSRPCPFSPQVTLRQRPSPICPFAHLPFVARKQPTSLT